MKSISIANNTMPSVGFGTYLIHNDQTQHLVTEALHYGYRHIDTAEGYQNEQGVGQAIQQFCQHAQISREEIFVTTKLWPGNPAWGMPLKDKKNTVESCEQSLRQLGLDYIDLYLIHAPFGGQEGRLEQWSALVDLQQQGKVKHIGVSNFNQTHIEEIISAGLPKPDANQIELHPWSPKNDLVQFLQAQQITPIAYSSLVPLSTWRISEGQDSSKTESMRNEAMNDGFIFATLAKKYHVTQAQILLRWAIQRGYPVLPKSENSNRIKANIQLFSFEITPEDMTLMNQLDKGDGVAWAWGDPLHTV